MNMISHPLGHVQCEGTLGTFRGPPSLRGGCLPVSAVLDLVLSSWGVRYALTPPLSPTSRQKDQLLSCDAEGPRQTGCPGKLALKRVTGREGCSSGQREKLSCGVVSRKAQPTPGRSEAGMALQRRPRLGSGAGLLWRPWTKGFSAAKAILEKH